MGRRVDKAMQDLVLTIAEPRQWDDCHSLQGDDHVLFVPTEDPPPVGANLRVRLSFLRGPQFFLNGVVIWRRPQGKGEQRLRSGVGLRVHSCDRAKVEYVRGYLRGGLLDKRASSRLPVRLQVTYRTAGTSSARRMNFTRDITETGLLLAAAELLPESTTVELVIIPPLELPPVKLQGTVVRHISDEAGRAMGIRLELGEDRERRRFARLLGDIERAFHKGLLPDQFIAK